MVSQQCELTFNITLAFPEVTDTLIILGRAATPLQQPAWALGGQ